MGVKISDLTAASSVADANEFEINESGTSKKVTASQIKSYATNATSVTAAGALMDSELTDVAAVKGINQALTTSSSPTFGGMTTTGNATVASQLFVGGNDTGGAGFVHVYGGTSGEGGEIRIYPSAAEDATVDSWSIDVSSDDLRIFNSLGDMAAQFNVNGGVDLYSDNQRKFHTYSDGGYVTGSLYASQSVTIGTGGNYQAGSLFSNGDWGMIFRAAQLNPNAAHFMWADYSNNELMRLSTTGLSIGTTVGSNKLVLGGETAQYPEALNILETGHATSTRAGIKTGGWIFGQDLTGLGVRDFFIFDGNTVNTRFSIDTSGGLSSIASNTTSAPTTYGSAAGQILRSENSEFALGLLNASPYPLYIQGRNSVNAARDIVLQPSGGRIGIGETNPQRDLHITNSTAAEIALTDSGAGKTHAIVSDGNQISLRADTSYNNIVGVDGANNYFTVRTNNSEKMRVDAEGNLWLYGTGTGDQRIEVGTNTTGNHYSYIDLIGDATYTDYGLRILRGNTGPNTHSVVEHRGTGDFYLSTFEAAPLVFRTSNTERVKIDSAGRVGINTSAPTGNLTVYEDITSVPNYYNGLQVEIRADSGTAGISLHRVGSSYAAIYHDTGNRLSFGLSSGTVHVNHDAGYLYGTGNSHPSKQWVNLNGQGTIAIRDSFNTSSIADYGTGRYTINISSAFSAVDYSIQANSTWSAGVSSVTNTNINGDTSNLPTTSSYKTMSFQTNTSTTFDPLHMFAVCHGN